MVRGRIFKVLFFFFFFKSLIPTAGLIKEAFPFPSIPSLQMIIRMFCSSQCLPYAPFGKKNMYVDYYG